MRINIPDESVQQTFFKDILVGECFESCGNYYIKVMGEVTHNALRVIGVGINFKTLWVFDDEVVRRVSKSTLTMEW